MKQKCKITLLGQVLDGQVENCYTDKSDKITAYLVYVHPFDFNKAFKGMVLVVGATFMVPDLDVTFIE